MKYRKGFVSNSSSSSFFIHLEDVTPIQKYLIERHRDASTIFPGEFPYCDSNQWDIEIGNYTIRGYTSMANFDMEKWLERIGINIDKVNFDSEG